MKKVLFGLAFTVALPLLAQQKPVYLDATKPIEERVEDALQRLTLEEKVAMVHAQSKFSSAGVPRLGIPENWMTDGPHGIRPEVLWDEWDQAGWTNDSCVAYPALTCLAATWNQTKLITGVLDEFQKIVEYIKEHISPDVTFEYYDTICRQVANRIPNIRKFAASHDLVFFVSGKKSSNGKMLFSECQKVNPNSHLIDSAEEIDSSLLTGASSIGVCGATSTPKWLMEEISKAIQSRLTGQ